MHHKTRHFLTAGLAGLLFLAAPCAPAADGARLAKEKCEHCHGPQGNSSEPEVPIIAGIPRDYFLDTMKKFRSGERPAERFEAKGHRPTDMKEIAKALTREQIRALADYYEAQTFHPAQQAFDPQLARQGARVYRKRCRRCHEDNGRSSEGDAGRLAGQWLPYLSDQLDKFLSGERKPTRKMARQLKKLSADERKAVLHFFAAQTD